MLKFDAEFHGRLARVSSELDALGTIAIGEDGYISSNVHMRKHIVKAAAYATLALVEHTKATLSRACVEGSLYPDEELAEALKTPKRQER